MLADFELASGRSTSLTQLASLRGKGGALGTADGDGKQLDHPQLGGDFRPVKMADWTSMLRSSPAIENSNNW